MINFQFIVAGQVITVTGTYENTISELMQKAVEQAGYKWGHEHFEGRNWFITESKIHIVMPAGTGG